MEISPVCQGQNYRTIPGKRDDSIYGYGFNCPASFTAIPVYGQKILYLPDEGRLGLQKQGVEKWNRRRHTVPEHYAGLIYFVGSEAFPAICRICSIALKTA